MHIAAAFHAKARRWVNGRQGIFNRLETALKSTLQEGQQLVWVHCASLGEFEQARPLIEQIKKEVQSAKILLTFFSPSGYEVRKNYEVADLVFYLPLDTPENAKKFIELLPLKAALFIKYEFWFNYLQELYIHKIPTYLVSGVFRKNHYFFKPYGAWGRKQLTHFTHFFVQDKTSMLLLGTIGFDNVTISGDTRFDRVDEIANDLEGIESIKRFAENKQVLVIGSSWQQDIDLIAKCLGQEGAFKQLGLKLLIAPHEVDAASVAKVINALNFYGTVIRYSELLKSGNVALEDVSIIVVDTIGLLSKLYRYGQVAFIGGGFGSGIHNILEAAAYGIPTVFGPKCEKFNEAIDLQQSGGSFIVRSSDDLTAVLKRLYYEPEFLKSASEISKNYVSANKGATRLICKALKFAAD